MSEDIKRLSNGKRVSGLVELRMITDEKRVKADEKIYNELVSGLFVPENTGAELAAKYGMSPDKEIGQYIHKLMVASFGVGMGTHKLTQSQAQQIMLIVLASILYGTYEFGQNIDNKDVKVAVNYLADDVKDVKECLNRALLALDPKPESFYSDYDLNSTVCGYINGYAFNKPKQRSLEAFGGYLSKYYKAYDKKSREEKYSKNFFKDYGRVLSRHLTDGYDSRKSIFDIRYSGSKVRDVCDLIKAVKGMGNEFVLAPAVNLYANVLKSYSEEVRKFHERHWAYPRGRNSNR